MVDDLVYRVYVISCGVLSVVLVATMLFIT
jgi:hypothetical protein